MQDLLTRKTEDTVQHPAWCDLDLCTVDPYDPLDGDHKSQVIILGDANLEMVWPGTDQGVHLLFLSVYTPYGKRRGWSQTTLTLRRARALHAELGKMIDAAGQAGLEHDEARMANVARHLGVAR